MKKLMIAAFAVVAFAAASQGAITKWKFQTGNGDAIYDGFNNTGSSYEAKGLGGIAVYAIARSTDTTGVGIGEQALLTAFLASKEPGGAAFSLANYAIPFESGNNPGTTKSDGVLYGSGYNISITNGTDDEGNFTTGEIYDFYLATVVKDGNGNDRLFIGTAEPEVEALGKNSTKTVTLSAETDSQVNWGDSKIFKGGGWYGEVGSVPEPTSGLLLLLGVAGLALRRRRV